MNAGTGLRALLARLRKDPVVHLRSGFYAGETDCREFLTVDTHWTWDLPKVTCTRCMHLERP